MARLGLLQFDILWENVEGNIEKLRRILAPSTGDWDLLVLPELWTCGFTMNKEAFRSFDRGLAFMKEVSQKYGCQVLGGLPAKTDTGQENRC